MRLPRRLASMSPEGKTDLHNMVVSLFDGVFDATAMGMVPVATVVVYFITGYVSSAFLVGLLTALRVLAQALGELFFHRVLDAKPRFVPGFLISASIFRLGWLLLGVLVLLFGHTVSPGFIVGFYVIFAVIGFGQGGIYLCFSSVTNKIIPARHRSKYLGFRGASCMVGSVAGAMIAKAFLAGDDSYLRFGWLILIAAAIDWCSMLFIFLSKEKPTPAAPRDKVSAGALARGLVRLWRDKPFRAHLVSAVLGMFVVAAFPLQTQVARMAGMGAEQLALMTTVMLAAQAVGVFCGGFVVSKWGYRSILVASYAFGALYFVGAMLLQGAMGFTVLAVVFGLYYSLNHLALRNIVARLMPVEERVTGFMLVGVITSLAAGVFPLVCGWLADGVGFVWLCALLLPTAIAALVVSTRVREGWDGD